MSSFDTCKAKHETLSRAFADWSAGQPGQRVTEGARAAVGEFARHLFGYELLQLGELGDDLDYLATSPVRRKTLVTQRRDAAASEVIVADPERLPVAPDCIDAMILAFALDFASDPRQVLREVERVLIAEGRVIIVGFNPFSLWGVWRLFGRWRGEVPWCGHFLSYPRLNDWLALVGLDVERMEVFEFRPPMRSPRLASIERMGHRVWPMLAGVYVVQAVKRVSRITPVRPRWESLQMLGRGRAIEPTVRSGRG